MNHGHVTPNPDGSKARCGGPAICAVCAKEAASVVGKDAFDYAVQAVTAVAQRCRARGCTCAPSIYVSVAPLDGPNPGACSVEVTHQADCPGRRTSA